MNSASVKARARGGRVAEPEPATERGCQVSSGRPKRAGKSSVRGACCKVIGACDASRQLFGCERENTVTTHDIAAAKVAPEAGLDEEVAATSTPAVVAQARRLASFQ